jgi:hypothetical protein
MAFDTFLECLKDGEMFMYFLCDFNGKWLKDLSFLCCVSIILASVEGRSVKDSTNKLAPLK